MSLVSGVSFVGAELFLVTYFVIQFTLKRSHVIGSTDKSISLRKGSVEEHVALIPNHCKLIKKNLNPLSE